MSRGGQVKKGYLVFEDATLFEGGWLLDDPNLGRAGEIVFNTSHTGYQEIASDPSYFNQIVVMTAPMQGNYGAADDFLESKRYWIQGFVCLRMQNTQRERHWVQGLVEAKIPVLSGVDTRSVVLRVRSGGTPWGALVSAANETQAVLLARDLIAEKKQEGRDWVHVATRKEISVRRGKVLVGPRVGVLDFGTKENILRELETRCSEIVLFPSRTGAAEILAHGIQGLMLTNGPGDPAEVQVAPETVRGLLGQIPLFGICMGHQILARALGAETYKLRFGHRGSNHPVRDELLGRIYMTSHNHGYAVKGETLPEHCVVTQRNLNDQTVSGFFSEKLKCLGIQYHPEACPGPHEAHDLFRFFTEVMI